jgi:hypothetical protein
MRLTGGETSIRECSHIGPTRGGLATLECVEPLDLNERRWIGNGAHRCGLAVCPTM